MEGLTMVLVGQMMMNLTDLQLKSVQHSRRSYDL